MIGGKSLLAQLLDNQRKHASSSAAPLPASKRQKTQPGATRAVVSAESLGDEGDGASIAGGVLETQEEHERVHRRNEWSW